MAADRDVLAELGRRVREREAQLQTHADPTRGPSRARQEALLGVLGLAEPRRRPITRWVVGTALAAGLAALGLWRVVDPGPSLAPTPTLATVGAHTLELGGGRATHLGDLSAPRYHLDDTLVLRMRPLAREAGPRVLSVRAHGVTDGTVLHRTEVARAEGGGAIELRTRAGDLLAPGRWRVEVGVGAPGGCDDDHDDGCTWAATELEILAAP